MTKVNKIENFYKYIGDLNSEHLNSKNIGITKFH